MSSSKTHKSKVKETTCRNWAFASDFEIEVVDGIVAEALCTPCSSIDEKKLKQTISQRNLSKQIEKSIVNYRQPVTYIHHGTLQRHVGTSDSFITGAKLNWEGQ